MLLSAASVTESLVQALLDQAEVPEDRLVRFAAQPISADDGTRLANLVTISPSHCIREQTATVIALARGTSIGRKPIFGETLAILPEPGAVPTDLGNEGAPRVEPVKVEPVKAAALSQRLKAPTAAAEVPSETEGRK